MLLNCELASNKGFKYERDMAKWHLILERNKTNALHAEVERLQAELRELAGEVEELRARLALLRHSETW